jgi:hypothetical protein
MRNLENTNIIEVTTMKLGKYKHYKGNYYQVLGLVHNTETREKMVLYRALYDCPDLKDDYGDDPWFVRPFDMFNEFVEIDGVKILRFEYVSDE